MSHRATNWAIGQRGLKPAAKIVLWHLADAHNPHHGCFPRQDTLAEACEMSRSTVNLHLKALEDGGLIRRIQSRCEQTNRQKATRYLLGFEFEDAAPDVGGQTQDVVVPCPKTGHGNGADSVSETAPEPCPKNGESRVRNSDSMNPVREPVRETGNQREDARENAEGAGNDQHPDVDGQPAPETVPGRAAFEKRVLRFCNGKGFTAGAWPDWDTGTPSYVGRQMAGLAEPDRQAAERWRDPYLADIARRGRKPVSPGNFLRDRLWEGLDPAILQRAETVAGAGGKPGDVPKPNGYAPPFGPVWSAYWVSRVMAGPEDPDAELPEGALPGHFRRAWPQLMALGEGARLRRGSVFGPRWHAMKDAMSAVPVGSDLAGAWEALFAARRWPWFPRADGMKVVYLPKLSPAASPSAGGLPAEGPDGRSASPADLEAALAAFKATLDTKTQNDGATGDDRAA